MPGHTLRAAARACLTLPPFLPPWAHQVKVLRCIKPVQPHDVVLGQYEAANGQPGYKGLLCLRRPPTPSACAPARLPTQKVPAAPLQTTPQCLPTVRHPLLPP